MHQNENNTFSDSSEDNLISYLRISLFHDGHRVKDIYQYVQKLSIFFCIFKVS